MLTIYCKKKHKNSQNDADRENFKIKLCDVDEMLVWWNV